MRAAAAGARCYTSWCFGGAAAAPWWGAPTKQIYEEYVPLSAALKKHTELLLDHLEEKGDWLVRHRASWQQAQLVARLQSGRRARELVEELESLSRRARELVEAR